MTSQQNPAGAGLRARPISRPFQAQASRWPVRPQALTSSLQVQGHSAAGKVDDTGVRGPAYTGSAKPGSVDTGCGLQPTGTFKVVCPVINYDRPNLR